MKNHVFKYQNHTWKSFSKNKRQKTRKMLAEFYLDPVPHCLSPFMQLQQNTTD